MRVTASYFFCSIVFCPIVLATLSVAPAAGEERDANAAADSPWDKTCLQGTCYVSKSRSTYCGLIGNATLAERKAEAGKVLSIGLPLRINPDRAVRIMIDGNEPISRPVATCNTSICRADYEAGAELVELLKQGQMLSIEAVNPDGAPYKVTLALAGFAEAYDRPPTPVPLVKLRITSDAEVKADREQHAAAEYRARCGPSP